MMVKSNTKKQVILSLLNKNLETYFCDIPRCERPDVEIEDNDDNKIYVYTPYDGEILTFNPQDSIKDIVKSLTCKIIKIKLTEDRNYEVPYGVRVHLNDYENAFIPNTDDEGKLYYWVGGEMAVSSARLFISLALSTFKAQMKTTII